MKALVIRRFGGPEVLEILDVADPVPGPDDVLIGVRAVSVGRTLDVEVRKNGGGFNVRLPRVLGSDPAGVVLAVGSAVTDLALGDRVAATGSINCGACVQCCSGRTNACVDHRVLGVHVDGGAAELCSVPSRSVTRIPDHVSFVQAAAMAVNYPVAWNLLAHAGLLRQGQDVLIMGAGGGLGLAGIAVAQALGARVIAAAGSEWKLERCRALFGLTDTVNYSLPGWSLDVRAASTGGRGVAVVFENISAPELFGESLASLRTYGRLVTCGAHGGGQVSVDMRTLYRRHLTILGEVGATTAMIQEVWRAVADRRLAPPPVYHQFPLEEAAAAHEAAEGRELFGRAVLIVGNGHGA